jgi:hypothetical protein
MYTSRNREICPVLFETSRETYVVHTLKLLHPFLASSEKRTLHIWTFLPQFLSGGNFAQTSLKDRPYRLIEQDQAYSAIHNTTIFYS